MDGGNIYMSSQSGNDNPTGVINFGSFYSYDTDPTIGGISSGDSLAGLVFTDGFGNQLIWAGEGIQAGNFRGNFTVVNSDGFYYQYDDDSEFGQPQLADAEGNLYVGSSQNIGVNYLYLNGNTIQFDTRGDALIDLKPAYPRRISAIIFN